MIAAIYSGLDVLLPFSWLDHNFMKNALLAVLLVTPLFGLLSTMVVSSRMAFFSDSLGHGAFTGIALGAILGLSSPLFSLAAFSVIFALFITYIKNRSNASTDTVIGVFSSTAIAAGLMIMSRGGSFNKFSAYLIGDILSVAPEDLAALAMVFLVVAAAWAARLRVTWRPPVHDASCCSARRGGTPNRVSGTTCTGTSTPSTSSASTWPTTTPWRTP